MGIAITADLAEDSGEPSKRLAPMMSYAKNGANEDAPENVTLAWEEYKAIPHWRFLARGLAHYRWTRAFCRWIDS